MSIPGDASPLLLGGGAQQYKIERSLRFNSSDSAYLSRTPSSAGNRKTFTLSTWVKRSRFGAEQAILSARTGAGLPYTRLIFRSEDTLWAHSDTGLSQITTQVFRDPSAWFHLVWAVDTTSGTASSRSRLYVNGTEVTTFSTANYPTQNTDLAVNSTVSHEIGVELVNGTYFSGYLAEFYLIDGQQLTPSSFTEVSATTGQLIPKDYTGTYGTNGFKLTFSDNSNNTATTLGKDSSPNGNNWTPINLAVANFRSATLTRTGGAIQTLQDAANAFDGVLSTSFICEPSNPSSLTLTLATGQAFSTLEINGYVQGSSKIIINGVDISSQLIGDPNVYRTITGVTSPFTTLFMEVTGGASIPVIRDIRFNGVSPGWIFTGSDARSDSLVDTPTSYGTDTGAGGEVRGNYATLNPLAGVQTLSNGNLDFTSVNSDSHRPATIALTTGKWYCEFTASSAQGVPGLVAAGFAGTYPGSTATSWGWYGGGNLYNNGSPFLAASFTAGDVVQLAFDADSGKLWFGKNGTWLSSGNPATGTNPTATPGVGTWFFVAGGSSAGSVTLNANFGQRQWAYAAPAGFKALCDTNLPAPVVAKPNTAFDVKLYTGNGSTQTISGLGFSPDLVWIKSRSAAYNNRLYDQVRGVENVLNSNTTAAEVSDGTGLTAFTSSGFTLGSSLAQNENSSTFVAWTWDAGSSTVTNTQGSITTSVRANVSAGFSIVTYTGNGSNATVGHGLGVAPSFIIVKKRSSSENWLVWFKGFSSNEYLYLNATNAKSSFSGTWGSLPTSSLFGVFDQSVNASGQTFVAYCFAPVAGYSSFGSYTGNGSADGPFVYTGFRPRWLLIKVSSTTGDWILFDSARATYNGVGPYLFPNTAGAENSTGVANDLLDMYSNGFKLRGNYANTNQSSSTYVYAAFAENCFQYARAR